jgi:meso-butanediol dehydrogenase / (S,S)-butanediol dehydrogenase / diacetyl reductase
MNEEKNMEKTKKKVALVTGAGAGIGRAIALQLAKGGFALAVNDIRAENALKVSSEIKDKGFQSIAVPADVSNAAQVKKMVDKVMETYGRIDVLVNNAGILHVRSLFEITAENLLNTFNINVVSMLLCTQAVAKHMIKQGGGKIINAASQAAFTQSVNALEYGVSKWAIRGFTRSLALSLAPYNITVNAYCPGSVESEMQSYLNEGIAASKKISPEENKKMKIQNIPLGRFQRIEDIAAFVSFMASDSANNITGQNMLINGGNIMV